jgi:hypothetical protein
MRHVRICGQLMSVGLWSYQKLAGPFISQAPVDECLQQISRILRPAPQGGAVSPRRIATPIHPRARIFPSHLSIRPDSPCHQLMEHGFGPPEGSISPGSKTFIACVIGQPKQFWRRFCES